MAESVDAIVVGGGLAGLTASAELADRGRRVVILEQEGENSLGGQAFRSLGGLFFIDSAEQRRLRMRDSRELVLQGRLSRRNSTSRKTIAGRSTHQRNICEALSIAASWPFEWGNIIFS